MACYSLILYIVFEGLVTGLEKDLTKTKKDQKLIRLAKTRTTKNQSFLVFQDWF